jgi:hypothetical protein
MTDPEGRFPATDPVDAALQAAAGRLRRQAPDDVATRQALGRALSAGNQPVTSHRSKWPALIGAALAAAAIVGVVAIRAADTETIAPVQTPGPEVQPTPTSSGVTSTTEPEPPGSSLVGNDDPGSPVDGLAGALAFVTRAQDGTVCSRLLVPDRSEWKEACGLDGSTTALVRVDQPGSTIHEITVDDGLITAARPLDTMAPSSGCSIDSADALIGLLPPSSIVTSIGCLGDEAALTTASVLIQEGPPDGSIWLAGRSDDAWTITDSGTGIETPLSFPVVPIAAWETWPASTAPGFRPAWWEPVVALPVQPTVDALADELLATLAELGSDPEFPLTVGLVVSEPNGLPLIVARVDSGGDDSVAGAMIHVWLEQQFDDTGPIGWRARAVLVGDICARGESTGELCV